MARVIWLCGLIVLVAVGLFPFVPEAPVDATARDATTSQEQDPVIKNMGPLRIAIEQRLRWLKVR